MNIFIGIVGIDFDENSRALSFFSKMGKDKETMTMVEYLDVKEQIELWLLEFETIMKKSVRKNAGKTSRKALQENELEVNLVG